MGIMWGAFLDHSGVTVSAWNNLIFFCGMLTVGKPDGTKQ